MVAASAHVIIIIIRQHRRRWHQMQWHEISGGIGINRVASNGMSISVAAIMKIMK